MTRGPTRARLIDMLAKAAGELRTSAWIGQGEDARLSFTLGERVPIWCQQAEVAFDAMDLLGTDYAAFSAARALRPWVGEVVR